MTGGGAGGGRGRGRVLRAQTLAVALSIVICVQANIFSRAIESAQRSYTAHVEKERIRNEETERQAASLVRQSNRFEAHVDIQKALLEIEIKRNETRQFEIEARRQIVELEALIKTKQLLIKNNTLPDDRVLIVLDDTQHAKEVALDCIKREKQALEEKEEARVAQLKSKALQEQHDAYMINLSTGLQQVLFYGSPALIALGLAAAGTRGSGGGELVLFGVFCFCFFFMINSRQLDS